MKTKKHYKKKYKSEKQSLKDLAAHFKQAKEEWEHKEKVHGITSSHYEMLRTAYMDLMADYRDMQERYDALRLLVDIKDRTND